MAIHMTKTQWENGIIGQDDDEDYSESGYVAWIHEGVAYLAKYSHCSCYDTFADLCGGGVSDYFDEGDVSFVWSGTPVDLVAMAGRKADPDMPDRVASEEDYDYDHLCKVYDQVISWSENLSKEQPQ